MFLEVDIPDPIWDAIKGYSPIPHVWFDVVQKELNVYEWAVLSVFLRRTYGWHKQTAAVSHSLGAAISGMSKNSWIKYVRSLKNKGFLEQIKDPIVGSAKSGEDCSTVYKLKTGYSIKREKDDKDLENFWKELEI